MSYTIHFEEATDWLAVSFYTILRDGEAVRGKDDELLVFQTEEEALEFARSVGLKIRHEGAATLRKTRR